MTLYEPEHRCQYDYSSFTAQNGCTWTTGATGADASTGGRVDVNPDQVKARVRRSEETNPLSEGWSMRDLALAMTRLNVPFENRTGQQWADLVRASAEGKYIVLQGDSDQFGNSTCSGAFNGDHCVGIRPGLAGSKRPIDDPICRQMRWEESSVLRAYAEKLARRIGEYPRLRFGVFTIPVPLALPDTASEDTVYSIKGVDGPFPATVKAGTPYFASAEDPTPTGTINDPSRPFTVVGESKDGQRRCIYGKTSPSADRARLGWVASTAVVR